MGKNQELKTKHQLLGKTGEQFAQKFLTQIGYKILKTNYRCRHGEIDIVCQDGKTIVFVEVKTRTSEKFGTPSEAVTSRKQNHLHRAAWEYLIKNNLESQPVRFDVLTLSFFSSHPEIEHIIGAF
ncbi:MAG: YraN family protein [candidate division WOR-3 bacterium]